ncbi:MAG: peptidoglycan-binding protein [Gammaproteobacteria bacterium]|nr:peptidoglycan-binding protein [Gammaproteobacteria bacterium]MDH3411635.1 peptidoglycan-binding protein [Gammaproteobacteria bacterium]
MKRQLVLKLSAASVLVAVAGCSSVDSRSFESLRGTDSVFSHSSAQLKGAEVPPNAKPGQCYARVYTPPVYSTESNSVLKRAAAEKVDIIPTQYKKIPQQVMVRPVTQRVEVVPATYEWVEERIMVSPASKRIEEVPAVYETITEQVIDKPAYTVWKKGASGPIQKVDEATGDILCLVEVPATYKTVTKEVLKTPATTREIEIPAEYTAIKKEIVKTPATTRTVEVPAEYKTITVTRMIAAAREVRTPIPAEYQTVTQEVLAQPESVEWRQILCATNTTPEMVSTIQRALAAAGFKPGRTDGLITQDTFLAVNAYQKAQGLPVDNDRYINIQTVKALGVSLN